MSECPMSEIDCFNSNSERIGLGFVERERTFRSAIRVGIQLHLADLPLSNTK
jgi:hypothetical protein